MALSKLAAKRSKYNLSQVIRMSDLAPLEHIPFGISQLDFLTRGGLIAGALNLFSGKEGSGKTSTALLGIRGFQRRYPKQRTVYVDSEHRVNPTRASALGVDPTAVEMLYPANLEEAHAKIKETVLHRPEVGLIIVDSLASLCPQDELASDPINDQFIGLGARGINRLIREITAAQCVLSAQGRKVTLLATNQERVNVKQTYGDGVVLPHGKAQLFLSSLWLRFLSNSVELDEQKMPLSTTIKYVVLKNSDGPPRLAGEFPLNFFNMNGNGPVEDKPYTWLWGRRTGVITSHGQVGFSVVSRDEKLSKADLFTRWSQDQKTYEADKLLVFTKFWDIFDSRQSLDNTVE